MEQLEVYVWSPRLARKTKYRNCVKLNTIVNTMMNSRNMWLMVEFSLVPNADGSAVSTPFLMKDNHNRLLLLLAQLAKVRYLRKLV